MYEVGVSFYENPSAYLQNCKQAMLDGSNWHQRLALSNYTVEDPFVVAMHLMVA